LTSILQIVIGGLLQEQADFLRRLGGESDGVAGGAGDLLG